MTRAFASDRPTLGYAFALCFLTGSAFAGNPVVVPAEPKPTTAPLTGDAPDWSGLHLGLFAARAGGDNTWDDNSPTPANPGTWSGSLSGSTIGFGIESMLGDKLSLSAEYLRTDLGTLDLGFAISLAFQTIANARFLQGGRFSSGRNAPDQPGSHPSSTMSKSDIDCRSATSIERAAQPLKESSHHGRSYRRLLARHPGPGHHRQGSARIKSSASRTL